jgi:hypothetical protein
MVPLRCGDSHFGALDRRDHESIDLFALFNDECSSVNGLENCQRGLFPEDAFKGNAEVLFRRVARFLSCGISLVYRICRTERIVFTRRFIG